MGLEHLLSKEIIVPLAVFAMPVAMVWIKRHYMALEKGVIKPGLSLGDARVAQLEKENRDLLARVQNLESIVCALDEAPQQKALPSPDQNKMTVGS